MTLPSEGFARDYRPFDPALDPPRTVDRLLKRPGQLAYELCEGHRMPAVVTVTVLLLLCAAAYGLLMGSFSGGAQYWRVPLKLAGGLAATAMICLPSLYIFSCLAGSRLTLARTALLLAQGLALSGLLLCGFLPVVWIFSQSTQSLAFMGFIHFAVWLCCSAVGLGFLRTALAHHQEGRGGLFRVWAFVFVIVSLQMSTFLRPLIGPADDPRDRGQKMFFLRHWAENVGPR